MVSSEGVADARDSSAALSVWGKSLPRRSALLRMPAEALGERKYFGATSLSKIDASEVRDDEQSSPSLRDTEKSGIKDPPRDSSPEPRQPPENLCKISSVVGAEEPGDVLENNESWISALGGFTHLLRDPDDLPEKTTPITGESGALPGDGQILTWETGTDDIDRF